MMLPGLSHHCHSCFLIVSTLLLVFLLAEQLVNAVNPITLHGLNYNTRKGPDWDPDKCKEWYEVVNDLTLLSRMTKRFRLLSMTDCGQAAMVLEVAQQLDLSLYLGLWVGPPPESSDVEPAFDLDLKELERLIEEHPDWIRDHVLGISVGSEALYRKDATLDEMIENFNTVRTLVRNSNLDLPVTICDIAPEYAKYPELREVVDVIMTNTFPFWEAIDISVAADDLDEDLTWLTSQPESVTKQFILGETGWPSAGFIEGVGIASPENQLIYFETTYCLLRKRGWDYYWFTGIDNGWRSEQDPENTIEEHWGFFYTNSTLKPHFRDFVFTCEDGETFDFSLLDVSLAGNTAAPTPLNLASCAAHPDCAGLLGECCPDSSGISLLCCDSSITAPSTTTPASPSTKPVASPTRSPSSTTTTTPQPATSTVTEPPVTSEPTETPNQPVATTPSPATKPSPSSRPTDPITEEPSTSVDATTVPSPPTPKPTIEVAFIPSPTQAPTKVDLDSINGANAANGNSASAKIEVIFCGLSSIMIAVGSIIMLFRV